MAPPSMADSSGIAGYVKGVDGSYLHLAGSAARLVQQDAGAAGAAGTAARPYLVDANARLVQWQPQADGGVRFTLQGHVPLELRMSLPPGCSLSPINPSIPFAPDAVKGSSTIRSFRSAQHSVELQAQCRGL
jgi:hypothetical protein